MSQSDPSLSPFPAIDPISPSISRSLLEIDTSYRTLYQQAQLVFQEWEQDLVIQKHELSRLVKEEQSITLSQGQLRQESELIRMALSVIQQLVDRVSVANIERIEKLCNFALQTIFFDLDLHFSLVSEIKRNQNTYRIQITQGGVIGNLNSFGGGVLAVLAVVLKLLFNVLSKSYPLVVLDESLSFLSDKYIPRASSVLKEFTREFHMPIVLVTHQPAFSAHADILYMAESSPSGSVVFQKKDQTELED